jgi:hypothetical protein
VDPRRLEPSSYEGTDTCALGRYGSNGETATNKDPKTKSLPSVWLTLDEAFEAVDRPRSEPQIQRTCTIRCCSCDRQPASADYPGSRSKSVISSSRR